MHSFHHGSSIHRPILPSLGCQWPRLANINWLSHSIYLVVWWLFCGGCSLVGINMQYKDHHTLYPFSSKLHAFSSGFLVFSLQIFLLGSWSTSQAIHHCLWVCVLSSGRCTAWSSAHWEDFPSLLYFKATPKWGHSTSRVFSAYFHLQRQRIY